MWILSGEMPNSPGEAPLRQRKTLARRIDRAACRRPSGHDRVRLHRVVILRRRLVGRLDPLRRGGETGLDIAAMHFRRIADADARRHEALGRIEPDPRRLASRSAATAARRLPSRLERFRDHDRDRLVGVTHAVVLQQVEPEHEGVGFSSGSCASAGLLAGVITSTTPGCAFAASTSRKATRPRAMLLTASTA